MHIRKNVQNSFIYSAQIANFINSGWRESKRRAEAVNLGFSLFFYRLARFLAVWSVHNYSFVEFLLNGLSFSNLAASLRSTSAWVSLKYSWYLFNI